VSLPRMGLRFCFLTLSLTVLSFCGCASDHKDSGPRIVSTAEMADPLESLPDASAALGSASRDSSSRLTRGRVPTDWYPPRSIERHWQSIVIHHSATPNGNMAIFDKWHREGNHWDGVGYDFVIGNGTDSPDGLVEVTFRWHQQITGAHCKTPGNWHNENAVGICLVGNFDNSLPSEAQMRSLTQLVRYLSGRYRIPADMIYGHNSTPGALETNCPGSHFGLTWVNAMLSK
jgi:hypothetical protein